jgi:nitroimidazol reductase NimA-like FMN-containing flavoprotein (pyridoxamine 5'-phosphate oxidase superfamily)
MAPVEELSRPEIDAFLGEELVGRIGCHAGGETYVVPVIYAYDGASLYVYSVEGRKLAMMRANPEVCFEVDRYEGPGRWRSVIAWGRFEELAEEDAERARSLLAARFPSSGAGPSRQPPRGDGRPAVAFRIRVREASGRRKRPDGPALSPP